MDWFKVSVSDIRAERALCSAAALWAMVTVPLWLAGLRGWVVMPGARRHAREMLFGYHSVL